MRKIDKIIIHCTATPEGRNHTIKDIRLWHKKRGFTDIGYHYVIDINGYILIGRPLHLAGAHTLGHNANSIGIAYVGGMDKGMKKAKDTRTQEQKEGLLVLLRSLVVKFPEAEIWGHRDFEKKACPCFDAREEYKNV